MLEFLKRRDGSKKDGLVSAVVVAAGNGRRMKTRQSKYFLELMGKPIIAFTLEVFQQARLVDEVIVVTKEEDIVAMGDVVKAFSLDKVVKIVAGGSSRQESVACGLCEVAAETAYVLVHDGVRPFVAVEQIDALLDEAVGCDGAVLAVRCKDTLRIADDEGCIGGEADRERTYLVQTPQCFPADVLRAAYAEAEKNRLAATDDSTLVCASGGRVKLVEGDYDNIKITTPEDIFVAEAILRKRGELLEDW